MRQAIIGTAGHIDHGKTALVAALTGEDTDRLPEEQQRGISIDLGFSHLEVGGRLLGIVDVPGHEDFIRNMLAGASGIDLLLLVVAADEGVMPQTREHVAIARMLGVPAAVVALSRIDLIEPGWLELARDDVAEFLADTPYANAPVLPVSAVTGEGVGELRDALTDGVGPARGSPEDLFRLPVDRSFTVRGTGTVVTGTVWSGSLETEGQVRLLPGGHEARVRGLQVHGEDVEVVVPGQRAAIALAGVDREAAGRGLTVVDDEAWTETLLLTARVSLLPDSEWTIEHRQRVRVHLGTAEVMARVVLLDRETILPGETGWAQLRLESPLVARARDRFVLRSYSPVTTIGGGMVAEPAPPKRRSTPAEGVTLLDRRLESPKEALSSVLQDAGVVGVPVRRLPLELGVGPSTVEGALEGAVVVRDRAFTPDALAGVRETILEAVDRHHRQRPLQPGVDPAGVRQAVPRNADPDLVEHGLESLVEEGSLEMRGGWVGRAGYAPTLTQTQDHLRAAVVRLLQERADTPPRVDELGALIQEEGAGSAGGRGGLGTAPDPRVLIDLLELLERQGEVVRIEHDLFLPAARVRELVADVRERFAGRSGLSPADLREAVPLSRQYLIPVLEYMDREGVTSRSGNGRTVPAGGV